MKKILLITLLFMPFIGFSQTLKPIDGFLGIKFGSSKLAVINAIKARGGIFDKGSSNAKDLFFHNVKLGDRKTSLLGVSFIHDKVYTASFFFNADMDQHVIGLYDDLVKDIDDVYGPGKSTRDFKSGFKDGDGHEPTAIQNGYADIYTDWNEPNNNSIELKISTDLDIVLSYYDNKLQSEADAAEKAKNKADY